MTDLNFDDLEGGFAFNSSKLGVIAFLLLNLKHCMFFSFKGIYQDEFFISE